MTTRPGPQRLGFGVALVGVVTFVAGCFVPFYGFGPQTQSEFTFSLYESTTSALTPDSSVVHYAGFMKSSIGPFSAGGASFLPR